MTTVSRIPAPAMAALLMLGCFPVQHVRQQPMVLHYDAPAKYFEESLPIGNGRIGACVYGDPREDRLSLNDITLWTGEPDRGAKHPDIAAGVGAEAAQTLPAIREALDREDYRTADILQRKVQGHNSELYQPLGNLRIRYIGEEDRQVEAYYRELDIDRSVATVRYRVGGTQRTSEYFCSSPDSAIVIRITSDKPFTAALTLDTPHPHDSGIEDGTLFIQGYVAYHAYPDYSPGGPRKFYDPERGIHFCSRVAVVPADGTVREDPATGALLVEDCTQAMVVFVNGTSFNGFDKDPVKEGREYVRHSLSILGKAAGKSYDELFARHSADYTKLFGRVKIDLGHTSDSIAALPIDVQLKRYTDLGENNPALEALYYQFGRYLLISCSRTPGVPANLQGLWNEHMTPPWASNYTVNINLEQNYWPSESGALPEMHEPLLTFMEALSKTGEDTAKRYYGIDGSWCAAHNSDIWAMSCPCGLGVGHPVWADWNMGGAWLSFDLWERYLYRRDMDELKHVYPILKGAAQFCIDWLKEKVDPETGKNELITTPSTSPENFYITDSSYVGATLYGATSDLAIIRECLTDAVAAADVVGDKSSFASEAKEKLAALRPYHIGKDGNIQEWYHDWRDSEPTHRHQSHLIGVLPGHQITPGSTPELARAARRSLEVRGMETTGWSAGWRVGLLARLQDSEGAYMMLRRLLRYVSPDGYDGPDQRRGGGTYPNFFDAHSPFQIDGNFSGCAGVMEMLLYSSPDGDNTPLPALPKAWSEGGIEGIRARNGKAVTIMWKDGKTTYYKEYGPED